MTTLRRKTVLIGIGLIFLFVNPAIAVEYHCFTTKKYDFEVEYSESQLNKRQFAVKVEELASNIFISRCSVLPFEKELTCDRYQVDRVEYDKNVKIKKYYIFESQYDFQIFQDLSSLENNGRGGVQYGRCKVLAP